MKKVASALWGCFPRWAGAVALVVVDLALVQAELVTADKKRDWGPEQATGKPDTSKAGDIVTAWASATADGQPEWLTLSYAEPIHARSILVYASYNPGSLTRVTSLDADGRETELWSGEDPVGTDRKKGVSALAVSVGVVVQRIRLYLDSPAVAGWNEIDAVGIIDDRGRTHWATSASASTSYAERVSNRRAAAAPARQARAGVPQAQPAARPKHRGVELPPPAGKPR